MPLDLGGSRRGVDMGPSAFRIAGLGERLAALGRAVVDKGDLPAPIPETQERPRRAEEVHPRDRRGVPAAVRDARCASLDEGAMPLVLGGDHSLGAGSVAAAAALGADDAAAADRPALGRRARRHEHAGDARRAATCTACRSRRCSAPSRPSSSSIGGFSPKVLPAHTVLIGVRNLDEREKVAVRDSGVHVFTMKDIDRQGIAPSSSRR